MIGVIGVSQKSAPVKVREQLALDSAEADLLAEKIMAANYFKDLVILSTCNRTEIYFSAEGICSSGATKLVQKALFQIKQFDEDIQPYLFNYFHEDTVRHLFRVTSGLDSMILGEYQIVSQIKSSYTEAEERGSIGTLFHRFFNKALECSKQVRMSTPFNRGACSVSSAAVEKCFEQFPDLPERNILIIGTGDTGELVLKNLHKKGCQNISLINRTEETAQQLATAFNCSVLPYNNLLGGLHDAEVIITSVAGKEPILNAGLVQPHLNGHANILMIDLGVPRNLDTDITAIPSITLYNIDDLEEVIAMNAERKQEFVEVAEEIVETKVDEFTHWLNQQKLAPAIQNIDKVIDAVYEKELKVFTKDFSEEELQQIQKFNRHMSKKLKSKIVRQLKSVSDNGRITEFVDVINQLFDKNP
ncbi:glutamyl-tRNA reductase [Alkalitalea saponilacus]|uniref:Glutamyl-tRNA reductase n=1 Tax=Alkalitalea saponilacus TaxID=889453 RepID=A0A1T5HSF1_9BACT|nr:glutamyl-tRNA reductase [Alkalitalea saponilacus]ASB47699.1 glutamyl-tRNA reductase [Alkalitalea saponilacus]SKC23624.1 glutamyl-tRNA reductase [Alkalitalea saponilacus]